MEATYEINYNQHQSMLDTMPTAVLILDADANYIYSNPSFQSFIPIGPEHLVDKEWSFWLRSTDKKSLYQLLSDIKIAGKVNHKKTLQIHKTNGSPKFTTITITPFEDEDEWRYLLAFTNPEKRVAKTPVTKEELIADLEASNQLKDKILAIISHDIRSPISSLKGLSSGYFDEHLSPTERGLIKESLMSQLDAVSELTENLLRWASLSFLKKDAMKMEKVHLAGIVEQTIVLTSLHAKSKNIMVSSDIPEDMAICANKDQIDIVIRNLVTNAIKYTPSGGKVSISCVNHKTYVQIRIADTGIGLTSEQLSRLFTYSHNTTFGTNGEKGIGLGLLLCKEYIECNGGEIAIHSKENAGTTVIVDFQVTPASPVCEDVFNL